MILMNHLEMNEFKLQRNKGTKVQGHRVILQAGRL